MVVKLFGTGSIILLSASLSLLKKRWPDLRITLVTFTSNSAAAGMLPVFDEVLAINGASAFYCMKEAFSLISILRKKKFDLAIDLEYFSKLSTIFCRIAAPGAHLRGFLLPAFWRNSLVDSGIAFREDIHFAENVARLLHRWCDWQGPLRTDLRIELSASESSEVREIKKMAGNRKWIFVNPNAHEMCLERRWPVEKFAALMENLGARWPDTVYGIVGSPDEAAYCSAIPEMISRELRPRVFMLAGRTSSFASLAAVLSQGSLLITNDTGIMHLGAAVRIPVVVMFGPESHGRYGPLAKPDMYRAVSAPVPCGPCLSFMNKKIPPCGGNNICMKHLDVKRVADACVQLMNRPAQTETL
jgi:ADP-heptose:LPS heptosyltransferase